MNGSPFSAESATAASVDLASALLADQNFAHLLQEVRVHFHAWQGTGEPLPAALQAVKRLAWLLEAPDPCCAPIPLRTESREAPEPANPVDLSTALNRPSFSDLGSLGLLLMTGATPGAAWGATVDFFGARAAAKLPGPPPQPLRLTLPSLLHRKPQPPPIRRLRDAVFSPAANEGFYPRTAAGAWWWLNVLAAHRHRVEVHPDLLEGHSAWVINSRSRHELETCVVRWIEDTEWHAALNAVGRETGLEPEAQETLCGLLRTAQERSSLDRSLKHGEETNRFRTRRI